MPKLDDLMPAELRERLRNAPARELPSAAAYLEGWQSSRASAGNAERADVEAAARSWREGVLTSGEVIATGFAAGAGIAAARVRIPAERWHGLRYDPARNAAVDRATKAVVATGLDFELAEPKRGRGRPKEAHPLPADDEAVRLLLRDAPRMTRAEFRRRAKAAMPGAKAIEVDALWENAREKRREIAGENRRISTSRQRV